MNEDLSLGQIVRERRKILDLTQAELARRVACATITIRKIEADDLRPSRQIAERLAMSLNVPLEERAKFVRLARMAGRDTPEPSPIPTPPPAPDEIGLEDLSGRAIRGYDLGERVGAGGFGAVYRAVQPLVEREVAIKIILPKYADHPDFIRRFEAEAQLVARLEHPHIVPLYDYWREPGVAYLVMRLLRGGSLAHMLKDGPLTLEVATMLFGQIGTALHAAHRVGVIHRDLKPANVLLDQDGNGYLADFGIAKNLSDPDLEGLTQAGMLVGSPAYASPEQIRSESVKPQADIYCLGVLLYEMLAGRQPFQGPTPIDYIQQHLNQPLPTLEAQLALDPVVRRATAKEPLERYPDVPSLLTDFREALAAKSAMAVAKVPHVLALPDEELENPYKGLRPFGEADADDFFGRETLVQELLGLMGEADDPAAGSRRDLSRFLAVVGPSGSGKSSVVKAGLTPALRQGGLPGSENWFVVDFLPGAHPLEELEAALLRVAVNPPESLLAQLRQDERGLLRAVRRILPSDPEVELVLVIDQFEEVFTQITDEAVRAHLLDSLVTATLDPRSRLRLVVTLRADFTDRPLQYVDFGELVRQRTAFVLPLTPDELEEAIVGPTRRAGLALEPGLTATVVQDVGGQPGMLPLLQYALTELFERRQGRRLTLAAYQDSGGVSGALARRAEKLYSKLDEEGQEAARQLFLRLITLGEGVEDTRRRVPRAELAALTQPVIIGGDLARNTQHESRTSPIDTVIEQFGRYRLLTFDHDPATRGPTVEVAHEALLREWGRLRGWLEESRADVRMQRLLAAAAAEWQGAGREPSYLLRGARLAQFEGWAEGSQVALTDDERAYLEAGVAAREARQAEEAERQRRELETARKLAETEKARAETEKARAESESRRATVLRRGAVVLGGLALIAVVLAVIALAARQQANRSADNARDEADQRATAEAIALAEADDRATAEAIAVREGQLAQEEADLRATAEVDAILEGQAAQAEANNRATAEADARAEADLRATAEAIAVEEREQARRQASVGLASQATLELGGQNPDRAVLLALEALEHYPYTWQAERALSKAVLDNKLRWIIPAEGTFSTLELSKDGTRLLVGYPEGAVKILDAATGEELLVIAEDVSGMATWSPDESVILCIGREDSASFQIRDSQTGSLLVTQTVTVEMRVNLLSWNPWSPEGDHFVMGHVDGVARVWDAESGEMLLALEGHQPQQGIIANWFPQYDRIMTVGDVDHAAKLWDASTGEELFTFSGIGSRHIQLGDWSPGGDRFVIRGDGEARVYDTLSGEERLILPTGAWIYRAVWSPDGRYIVTACTGGTAQLWDAETGDKIASLEGMLQAWAATWSPSGGLAAIGAMDGTIRIWDIDTGLEVQKINGSVNSEVYYLLWSPIDDRIYVSGLTNEIKMFELDSAFFTLPTRRHPWPKGIWSPDSQRFFRICGVNCLEIWDVLNKEEVFTLEGEAVSHMYRSGHAWSPTGDELLVFDQNFDRRIWDAATGELLRQFPPLEMACSWSEGQCGPWWSAWSPDGSRIVTTDYVGYANPSKVTIWDAVTGETIRVFEKHGAWVGAVAWSPDGTRIASSSSREAFIWDPETEEILLDLSSHFEQGDASGLAWSPDGEQLVVWNSREKLGRIFDTTTGEELIQLCCQSANWVLTWLPPAGNRLLSSGGGTINIWDTATGAIVNTYELDSSSTMAGYSSDGHWMLVSSPENVRLYPAWHNAQELIDYAQECCVFRELTPAEREQFGLPERE